MTHGPNAGEHKSLPEGWVSSRFSELCSIPFKNGLYKPPCDYGAGAGMVHMKELFGRRFINGRNLRRVEVTDVESSNFGLEAGDLLLARRSLKLEGVGQCSLVLKVEQEMVFESSIIRCRPRKEMVCPLFVFYYLECSSGRKQMIRLARQVAVSGIASGDLKSYRIPVPPLVEQTKIAAVFSACDQAIELTEKLFEAKQKRKQSLMQQLLTGEVRLPDYKRSKWESLSLADLVRAHAFGPRFSSNLYSENGNVGTIRTTDLDSEGNINYETIPYASIEESNVESHFLNEGDLLISRSGTCGVPCVFESQTKPVVAGAFLIRFQLSDEIVPHFIFSLLKTKTLQRRIARLACGGVQKNLTGPSLLSLNFKLPQLEEQRAISDAIKIFERELQILLEKVDLLKEQKKGLMQQLLTGKVRFKIPRAKGKK